MLPVTLLLAGATPASAALPVEETTLVSAATDGTQGNEGSYAPAISADGRYITYISNASTLVVGDTNGATDVFVTDTITGTTTRISTASDGTQGDRPSYAPAISADGRYITYYSASENLVSGDTNNRLDVFLFDTTTGTTTLVSTATDGTQANESSFDSAISADGRYITYYSAAQNLVAGDNNGAYDVFLFDATSGTTTLVSTATDGTQGDGSSYTPRISADGRYIAYYSNATNLVAGDTNTSYDVFIFDTTTSTTTLVSTATDGTQGDSSSYTPRISADGRYVTYYSYASNLVAGDTNTSYDVFLFDTTSGTTTLVSTATDGAQTDGGSYESTISADGRYITYYSDATNIVAGDTNTSYDVFLFDTITGITALVSTAADGAQTDGGSFAPAISADGRYITYGSDASNLVAGDTNNITDIFSARVAVPAAIIPAAPAPAAALAATGSDPMGLLAGAALLLAAGILVMRARRTGRPVS